MDYIGADSNVKNTCAEHGTNETDTFVAQFECEKDDGDKSGGVTVLKRLKDDPDYRHRVLHTVCVCCIMIALGLRNGLVGPTFPDLIQIIDEDLATASWLFTAISFGGLIGSSCGGAIYDHVNKLAVFVFIVSGFAAISAITPWCANFPAMFSAHVFHGIFGSAIDAVATSDTFFLWQHESGPFLQAVHLGFSVGSIFSPFISGPFLAELTLINTTEIGLTNDTSNITIYNGIMHRSLIHTTAEPVDTLTHSPVYVYGKTKIYIAYLITMAFCLLVSCLFILQHCVLGSIYTKPLVSRNKASISENSEIKLSKCVKAYFISLISLVLLLYVVNERNFVGYLMTFTISELGWSKTRGSNITALFFISFAVSRLMAIGLANKLKTNTVLSSVLGILFVGIAGFWISVKFGMEIFIWMSTGIMGLGMGPIFAASFTWLSENVIAVTGKLTGMICMVNSVGAMLFPLLLGYLMSNVSLMWFCYLQFILIISMGIVIATTVLLYRVVSK